MNFKEDIKELVGALDNQIVDGAKPNLIKLIAYLIKYQDKCSRGEIVTTQNIATFEVTIEEKGIDWGLLEASINGLTSVFADEKSLGEYREEDEKEELKELIDEDE